MAASNLALILAGLVGVITATVHGFIMQGHIIGPVSAAIEADRTVSVTAARLVPPLLQVSTIAWLLTGLLLIWAGIRAQGEPRWIVCAAALGLYEHSAVANALAVRATHPGWILMSICVILTVIGARGGSAF